MNKLITHVRTKINCQLKNKTINNLKNIRPMPYEIAELEEKDLTMVESLTEKRIDQATGNKYTLTEFIKHYGRDNGETRWHYGNSYNDRISRSQTKQSKKETWGSSTIDME